MQQQEIRIILEEEKDSNPIFRIIFDKLKFLKKKLAQIQHIRTLDHKTLKTAQLNKLHKQPEIIQEIQKNQEFARYYKSILIDHNLSYDKVDDLLKISTLFTVGRRIQADHYCPKELKELYDSFSNSILNNKGELTASQLSDEVVRVYHLLWSYLENETYYSQCRDYLTYLEDINQRRLQEGANLVITDVEKKTKVDSLKLDIDLSIVAEVNLKMSKLEMKSEVFNIIFDKDLVVRSIKSTYERDETEQIFSNASEKDVYSKQECSTTNPEGESESKDLDREPIDAITHPEIVWIQKRQSFEVNGSSTADDNEVIDPNHTRPKDKKRRNRKGKKTVSAEIECIRKGSEVTVQSVAEKHWGKVRYVEKKSL